VQSIWRKRARRASSASTSSLIRFAQQNLHQNYPELADCVEFHCIDIADLPEGDFDLMTSKDTFEHVMDLPKVLRDMRERLKSGGRLYAAIGPLWNSPSATTTRSSG
jgi:2-polyprenyl-3-methyl-5-hydroxy-6-metoxy-1,4-benzoquinol methylase